MPQIITTSVLLENEQKQQFEEEETPILPINTVDEPMEKAPFPFRLVVPRFLDK